MATHAPYFQASCPPYFQGSCLAQLQHTKPLLLTPSQNADEATQRVQCCRDVSERALRVLRKEAEKYSEVRSRLATTEGLQAAALFQQGLNQQAPLTQSPSPAGASPEANAVLQHIRNLYSANSTTCSHHCSSLLCLLMVTCLMP